MNDELEYLRTVFGTGDKEVIQPAPRIQYTDYDDEGIDIDSFNDAFDECYQIFLSRRIERGNYLEISKEHFIKTIKVKMRDIVKCIGKGESIDRNELIDVVLCGIELLSMDY